MLVSVWILIFTTIIILKFSGMSCHYSLTSDPEFTLDWDKIRSARLPIYTLITKGYAVDVTKNVDREFRLNQLGI